MKTVSQCILLYKYRKLKSNKIEITSLLFIVVGLFDCFKLKAKIPSFPATMLSKIGQRRCIWIWNVIS